MDNSCVDITGQIVSMRIILCNLDFILTYLENGSKDRYLSKLKKEENGISTNKPCYKFL